ncbi:MAG: isoaspartyl peptidase/L-asparaginase, partial [Parafilimonas sp.]|nr:isoaspartyl peptidase/L-asparaginase [Parafilimonas sp.]
MQKISIAIHGGAGPDSDYIKQNKTGYTNGLEKAIKSAYRVLEKGGSATDAVQEAVLQLEDNPLFNAGRGSALNNKGEIEMDSSIMEGETLQAGAVSMVQRVKNPVKLARYVMEHTNHVMLSGNGALQFGKSKDIELEADAYFITPHQYDLFMEERDKNFLQDVLKQRVHGTVGAVAVDKKGNVAAATSTGGTTNSLQGRIGDSCMIGAGCYANNKTCAVSGTGDGELLINHVIAHSISSVIEYCNYSLQQACDYIIKEKNKNINGDVGVISV